MGVGVLVAVGVLVGVVVTVGVVVKVGVCVLVGVTLATILLTNAHLDCLLDPAFSINMDASYFWNAGY